MNWIIEEVSTFKDITVAKIRRDDKQISGIWSSQLPPLPQQEIHIEIDINLPIEDLMPSVSDSKVFTSTIIENINSISGLLEDIDDDDLMHFFRISEDCLIMIESNGARLSSGMFYQIQVPVSSLVLNNS